MPLSRVPVRDRPRERLAAYGVDVLSDRELLALLLGTGGATGIGVHELAERLLCRFGSVDAVGQATVAELATVKGIGSAKASGIVAAFELARRATGPSSPFRINATSDVVRVAAPWLRNQTQQQLLVISCDAGAHVLGVDCVSDGTVDHTLPSVREIIVAVLRRDGRQFALAHNHPSGDPAPNSQDITATRAVEQAAAGAGLRVLDHAIVTDTSWRRVTTRSQPSAKRGV